MGVDPCRRHHSHDLVADVNRKSRRLLKQIAKDFRKQHGDLISNLPSYRISVLQLLDLSPRGRKREQSDQVSVTDALAELKSRSYISDVDGLWVALTASGLHEGTRGLLGRLWSFLDSSKGVATIVAALALVVSVATLVWQCTSASGTPLQQSGAP